MSTLIKFSPPPPRKLKHSLTFGGVVMLVVAGAFLFYPELPHLARDSFEYLEFHSHRTALYPAFLDLFGSDTLYNYQPKLDLIATTQTTIYVVATGFMLGALAHARVPMSILLVFLVAITSNYQLHAYHRVLVTESLGLSMVFFLIATLALWFHTGRYRWLAAAMLVAAVAYGLRPNMIAMPIGVAIIALCHIINTRHFQKPLLAIFVPFILVAGFESAYYHAHHATRPNELLHKHMFGKAALVLAIHEADGQENRFYQGEFASLKPFMHEFGEAFRGDRDRYWASGEVCMWLTVHALYEDGAYSQIELGRMSAPSTDWAWQVFSAYPVRLAQVITQHYLNFFCVAGVKHARVLSTTDKILLWQVSPSPTTLFQQFKTWAFLTLGIAFFASKIYYGYRWTRRIIRWLSSRFSPQTLTPFEALGSTLIMLAFGYNLSIAIFGVSIARFLIISFPLMVLGILLMAVVIAQGHLAKPLTAGTPP